MAPKLNFGGGGEPCALCGKTVYAAERLKTTSEHIFHKQCFRCTKCSSLLQLATYAEDAVTGRVYCKPHYGQLAAAAGIHAAATGGVDAANSSVLVQKKQKKTLQEDVEQISVGSKVWVELGGVDDAEPFILAEACAVEADEVSVRRGERLERVPRASAAPLYRADLGDAKLNNLQLLQLNEPNLLYNVRRRFEAQQIYTWTGQLELLAVNPYEAPRPVL